MCPPWIRHCMCYTQNGISGFCQSYPDRNRLWIIIYLFFCKTEISWHGITTSMLNLSNSTISKMYTS